MSMASSPKFIHDISAPNAPDNVTVTIHNMGNIYSYSADKLWLAYGLAIGITVLNVGLGLTAMLRTGTSYTLNFSTIFRAAKNADMSSETNEQRHPGKDPLPRAWKQAIFRLRADAVFEAKNLGSGKYSSVDQSGEDFERATADDEMIREEQSDEGEDALQRSWESGRADELRLSVQRDREEYDTQSRDARDNDDHARSDNSHDA